MDTFEHTRCDNWMEVDILEQTGWELVSVVHYPNQMAHRDLIYFMKRKISDPVPVITTE